jgi:hypothetical protein
MGVRMGRRSPYADTCVGAPMPLCPHPHAQIWCCCEMTYGRQGWDVVKIFWDTFRNANFASISKIFGRFQKVHQNVYIRGSLRNAPK